MADPLTHEQIQLAIAALEWPIQARDEDFVELPKTVVAVALAALRAQAQGPAGTWQPEVRDVAGDIAAVMSHYTKRKMVPPSVDERQMVARLEGWRRRLLDALSSAEPRS